MSASDEHASAQVVGVDLAEIEGISSLRVYIPKDLRTSESRKAGVKVRTGYRFSHNIRGQE